MTESNVSTELDEVDKLYRDASHAASMASIEVLKLTKLLSIEKKARTTMQRLVYLQSATWFVYLAARYLL